MIKFLIRKAFFDTWDNLLKIILLNVGYILILALSFFLPYLFKDNNWLFFSALVLSFFLFSLYSGAVALFCKEIADGNEVFLTSLPQFIKASYKHSLFFASVSLLFFALLFVTLPFYLRIPHIAGLVIASFILWFTLALFIALQFYFPIFSRMRDGVFKTFKKTLLVFLDNTLFSLVLALFALFLFVLSFPLGFMLIGLANTSLLYQNGFKLRLLKYDYLEKHPDIKGRKIPWDSLLEQEREKIGTRSLRGLIFPWKD